MSKVGKTILVILGVFPFTALLFFGSKLSFTEPNYSVSNAYYSIIDNKSSSSIDIYFNAEIANPSNYVELLSFLKLYSGEKYIRIILNTPGGEFFAGAQIIDAIRLARVPTVSEVNVLAASMGGMFLLSTSLIDIPDHALLMFHNITSRDGRELPTYILRLFQDLFVSVAKGFLTAEEIDAVFNKQGQVWMSGKEAIKRACKVNKLFGTKEYVTLKCTAAKTWPDEEVLFLPGPGVTSP